MQHPRRTIFLISAGILTFWIAVLPSLSCSREESSAAVEETQIWDATVAFLAGVFTVANAKDLDTESLRENFRANYDWLKDVFLPHLKQTPKHDWQICNEFCVETAKRLAKGDPEREEELRKELSQYGPGREH